MESLPLFEGARGVVEVSSHKDVGRGGWADLSARVVYATEDSSHVESVRLRSVSVNYQKPTTRVRDEARASVVMGMTEVYALAPHCVSENASVPTSEEGRVDRKSVV